MIDTIDELNFKVKVLEDYRKYIQTKIKTNLKFSEKVILMEQLEWIDNRLKDIK